MLHGQRSGYTKFPCFSCEWDSCDKKSNSKTLATLNNGSKFIDHERLVEPSKVLHPQFHIKPRL